MISVTPDTTLAVGCFAAAWWLERERRREAEASAEWARLIGGRVSAVWRVVGDDIIHEPPIDPQEYPR